MYKEGSHCAVLHMWLRIFSRSSDAISDVHLTADSFKSCQSLSEAMGINQHNMEYKLTQLLLACGWKREIILLSFSWRSESLLICMKKVEAFWEEYLGELLSKLNGLLRLWLKGFDTLIHKVTQLNYYYSSLGLNGTYVMIQKAEEDKEQNLICLAGLFLEI